MISERYSLYMIRVKVTFNQLLKKAVTLTACTITAITLALGAVVDSPDELFSGAPQAAQVVLCATAQDDCAQEAVAAKPAQKERLRDKLRRLFLAQPSIVRGIVLLPFWAIGKVLIGFLSLFFTALSPVLQILLGFVLNAVLLFGLFLVVLKLLFPNLRLRDFLTRRNILLLLAGSLILSAADTVLKLFWEDYRPISIAIKLGVGLIVLSLLAWRIFGKRIEPKLMQAT